MKRVYAHQRALNEKALLLGRWPALRAVPRDDEAPADPSTVDRPWWSNLFWSIVARKCFGKGTTILVRKYSLFFYAESAKSPTSVLEVVSKREGPWLKESQLIAPAFIVLIGSVIILRLITELIWRLL